MIGMTRATRTRCTLPALAALAAWPLACGGDGDDDAATDATETTDTIEATDTTDSTEVAPVCGDGTVDPDEDCDDGNDRAGDGCEADCRWTCTSTADCDDGVVCNGAETCAGHVCQTGSPVEDGTPCSTAGGADGTCRSGLCAPFACGNGEREGDEACDDGNLSNADDCLADCTAASCGDDFLHDGVEECDTGAPAPCTTSCGSVGTRRCVACAWETACAAPDEVCNGADDDCDDGTDEGFDCIAGTGESCTTPCGTAGTRGCGPDCRPSGDCTPPAETCNGADDDCDDLTDEGFACVPGTVTSCITACGTPGTRNCAADCTLPADCVPPDEICNGEDDDCDGEADEGFGCVAGSVLRCTTSCGSRGVRLCSSGCTVPDACRPPPESCNNLDDDCDTATDNGFECRIYTTGSCTTSCGSTTGTRTCDSHCTWGRCRPRDRETVCDGMDDDCNGTTDDFCPRSITTGLREDGPLWGRTTGGTPFREICPGNEVLIGLDGRGGCAVDGIQPVCGRPVVEEDRSVTPFAYRFRVAAGTSMPYHGGGGGSPFSLRCPADFVAVALAVRGSSTNGITGLRLECNRPTITVHDTETELDPGSSHPLLQFAPSCAPPDEWTSYFDAGDTPWGASGYEDVAALSGIHGRSGTLLDALGGQLVQMVLQP